MAYMGESVMDSGLLYYHLDGYIMHIRTTTIPPVVRGLNGEWTVTITTPRPPRCFLVELAEDVVEWWFG